MYYFGLTLSLFATCYAVMADDVCRVPKQKSGIARLKHDLLCSYDKTIRPTIHSGNVKFVYTSMLLRSLNYDEHHQVLDIHCFMVMEWLDENLLWTPSDYDGLKRIVVESENIWIPDIISFGRSAWNDLNKVERVRCLVYFNGMVTCVPRMVYSALCSLDLTYWPFDRIECNLSVGSAAYVNEEVNVDNGHGQVNLIHYEINPLWKLVSATSDMRTRNLGPNSAYSWIKYSFSLHRYSVFHGIIAGVPALVNAIVVSFLSWLSPLDEQRFHMSSFSLVFHCLYLHYLGWTFASAGETTPIIVQMQRNSVILLGASTVVAVALRCLFISSAEPPGWISGFMKFMLRYRAGQLILLAKVSSQETTVVKEEETDEEAGLVERSEPDSATIWKLFGTIIDRVLFIICVTLYLFMFLRWIT